MSLLKQLLISVTVAISVILVGTLWSGLAGARSYLNARLLVDAENAASSLALSLSQPQNQDSVTREVLMTALFDSGQYRSIEFRAPDGGKPLLLERAAGTGKDDVPGWFQDWLPIQVPTVTRAVSDGWKQTGEITVTPEDSQARVALWRMTYQVLLLVLGAGVLWALFATALMRWLRRALQEELAAQVRAIAEGDTASASELLHASTRIKELAQVRTVIESVRERVRATAEEQHRQIETLQLELNTDDVTGVANRKYFLNELRRTLSPPADPAHADPRSGYGHVLVFRQRDLSAINQLYERQETDAWLQRVSGQVCSVIESSAVPDRPVPQLARLNGSDFVILMAGYDGPDTIDLIESLRRELSNLRVQSLEGRLCRWGYALTDFSPGCEVSHVLARLDQGLMRAESAGHDEVEYIAANDSRSFGRATTGETGWKRLIRAALENDRLELVAMPARYRDDDVVDRYEASLVLHDDERPDTAISGYLFMPPAVRLNLSGECDLRATELALRWVRGHSGYLAFRVSLASLLQPGFLADLERLLQQGDATPEEKARLAIEIDAHGFVAYPDEVKALCELAQRCGIGVGVRRLAEQPAALLRLHKVIIRYVKLGGELISSLLESPGAAQLIAAITEAAIGQGVKIYAHDVPNASTAALLLEYGVLLPADEQFSSSFIEEVEGDFVDH